MQDELRCRNFRRVRLWRPAVDSHLFMPERRCAAMRDYLSGNDSERPLLLTVSRLAPEKNVELLAEILDQLPGVRLAVVGDGPQRAALERYFGNRPVRFVGYLTGVDLARAYASADVFVYASETETMGNVVLEAQASGLPVIAARAGGVPGLIRNGKTGRLFPPGDALTAAEMVREVLDDAELAAGLRFSARSSMVERGWKEAAWRLRQDYVDATNRMASGEWRLIPVPRLARLCQSGLVHVLRLITLLRPACWARGTESSATATTSGLETETQLPPTSEARQEAVRA